MANGHSPSAEEQEFVDQLVHLMGNRAVAPPAGNLELCRTHILPFADELLARAVTVEVQRIAKLSERQQRCLALFDGGPDLLSPMADERYEPIHTQMLAYFFGLPSASPLGDQPLRAFLALLDIDAEPPAYVIPEFSLSKRGRVDIRLALPGWLIYVEVKLAANERENQLRDYKVHAASQAETHGYRPVIVYLTEDDRAPSIEEVESVSFSDILAAWLPIAAADNSPAHRHLAMYLRTIAEHVCGVSNRGEFVKWPSPMRTTLLTFLETRIE